MKSPFALWRYAFALALILFATGAAHEASAQIEPLRQGVYDFGNVGVARGQIARLNAFYHNVLPPGPCAPGTACASPAGSFQATMSFVECDGSVTVQNVVTLTPDKGGTLVLSPRSFHADGRACARASVSVSPDANGFLPDLVPTVEVLDGSTGQSFLLNPGALAPFNPPSDTQSDFNFGLFNVVSGQTARVEASFVGAPVGFPPGPCRLTLSFYGGDGQLISQSIQSLDQGKTAQLDLPVGGFTGGVRTRVRASVHVESVNGFVPRLTTAVELFASDTGKGALFYPGAVIGSN